MTRRAALGVALLAVAALASAFAVDVLRWKSTIERGDRTFSVTPAAASWQATALLPADPARRALALGADLAFRRVAQMFEQVTATGNGVDNGLSEAAARGGVEADLAEAARTADRARAAAADNMLGILAFTDSRQTGASAPAPVEQAVADFQAAIRADPGNETAKYNLELLLRELVARGSRRGSNGSSGGPALGHRGASGGLPGRGY